MREYRKMELKEYNVVLDVQNECSILQHIPHLKFELISLIYSCSNK